MKHIQTIENLYNKAEAKGSATLNGRMVSYGWGCENHKGPLREKYRIDINGREVVLRHWGTETLRVDRLNKRILNWYGEGNSDRDSMNTLLNLVGIKDKYFRYGSRIGFILEDSPIKQLQDRFSFLMPPSNYK